jgi:AcrR family transcriptional regulator
MLEYYLIITINSIGLNIVIVKTIRYNNYNNTGIGGKAMDGFARRRAQSKEDILRAAEELFSRFGADKVSINDIARRAGVSQATIYNNFGSKENLVRDYHSGIVKKIASSFRGIVVMKKSWVDRLQGFLQSWIDIADRYQLEIEGAAPLGDGAGPSPGSVAGEIESSFRDFIREGREQGGLRADLSDTAVMTYIGFFQQGIAGNPGVHERMLRDPAFSRDLLSLFMYGVAGRADEAVKTP